MIDNLEILRKSLENKPAVTGQNTLFGTKISRGHVSNGYSKPITHAQRHKLMLQILKEARIVCTTLSMSASEMFNNFSLGDFEYLIVDEACQSVELTNLIPF